MDRPYGDECDMETAYYNLTGVRILALGARGAAILVEQPLLSYLLQTGFLGICGTPGFVFFRADDCTVAGTPYQGARMDRYVAVDCP